MPALPGQCSSAGCAATRPATASWSSAERRRSIGPSGGLQAAAHVVGEQLTEASVAQGLAVGALHEVEVGALVALDQTWPVIEDADVPADDDVIAEGTGMGAARELEHLGPERERAAEDLAAGLGMALAPAGAGAERHGAVGGAAEHAGANVDLGEDAAGVEVVDDGVFALGHAEGGVGDLVFAALVSAG